ncbi:hypothetical protein [Nocardioides abyssi]|uniref:Uncharacterized protein n=1 Tax=Nocardioides abyssi TaxID=3058370 RepID=A0ABT8EPC2_9ACTN|nr:hypothetical protein [Nocardioides abyssi]MDN4159975.1 hypothetical protein [Nocardioides abyssi]
MTRCAALAATVVLLGAGLPAASAAPADAPPTDEPPAERTVTVRGDCGPSGRVVLRQVLDGDRTTVAVRLRGVPDGRWRGEHLVEVGVDDTEDTRLAADVRAHVLAVGFEVDGAAVGGVLRLSGPRGAECHAAYSEAGSMVVVTDARLAGVVRRSGPRRLVARADVDCRPGPRWSVELGFSDESSGSGFGSPRVRCRSGSAVLREVVERDVATLPATVEVAARRPGGRHLRLRYVASDPAPVDLPSRR